MATVDTDILVIGAGISGISNAWHLQKYCPSKSYAIIEQRENIGGTWDLFRYPGIRSDSDMYTLGYRFKPWTHGKAIADGDAILDYLNETADENNIREKISFGRRVKSAHWSSADAMWTVRLETASGTQETRTTRFLSFCAGYYNYDAGYTPDFPGRENFKGDIIHPQHWPEELDYAGKRIIVIGSGATAVTLVPSMAATAGHVTMLQRTPSYVASRPAEDPVAKFLRRFLPAAAAYPVVRWKNVLLQMYFFSAARRWPDKARTQIIDLARAELPADYDTDRHFSPDYNPWDQRLCMVPDADLFKAICDGRASIVTDHIETFTEHGIRLKSGEELSADIIVTATGLDLHNFGGAEVYVDGALIDSGNCMTYKGMMYSGVPNLCATFGYTNASWTLKADLTSEYMCRILNQMEKTGATVCTPHLTDPEVRPEPIVDFNSGYFLRAADKLPKQGSKKPWRLNQNYPRDIIEMRFGKVEDGVLEFSTHSAERPAPARLAAE